MTRSVTTGFILAAAFLASFLATNPCAAQQSPTLHFGLGAGRTGLTLSADVRVTPAVGAAIRYDGELSSDRAVWAGPLFVFKTADDLEMRASLVVGGHYCYLVGWDDQRTTCESPTGWRLGSALHGGVDMPLSQSWSVGAEAGVWYLDRDDRWRFPVSLIVRWTRGG